MSRACASDTASMTRPLARIVRLAFVTLLALAGLFGGHAAQADAALLRR